MTGLDPNLTFCLGFTACALFMFIAEVGAHLIERRRILKRLEQLRPDPMALAHGDDCAWPLNRELPHRLSGVGESHFHARANRTEGKHSNA